jgi:hypothetical protein
MNDLQRYFEANPGRLIHKLAHYFEIYERHFSRFRNREVHVLEIGVFHGGSLQMWKHYFGPQAQIYGLDIEPRCKAYEESQIRVLTGSRADRGFLERLKGLVPRLDIVIDDGGHRMEEQLTAFDVLFDHVAEDGVYLCEDLCTSYWAEYGGGLRQEGTFIEYSKHLVDQLNAWYTRDPEKFAPDGFTNTAHSMHYYDGVLVIEKRRMAPPVEVKTGRPSF